MQGGIGGGKRSLMGRRTSSERDADSGCWRWTAVGTMVDRRRLFGGSGCDGGVPKMGG